MGQGAYILGCEGSRLNDGERRFFKEANPYGFIVFARNIDTPEQLRRLTNDLRDAVGRNAPILIDQEGGRVQRMGPPHWRQWLPPLDQIAQAGPKDAARSMFLRYVLIALELRSVGIDVNCAPMGDVADCATHPFLRNRCYGEDVSTVVSCARAVADGLLAGGVIPVLKHIPGHGRAVVDSHKDLPTVDAPLEALHTRDFAPFKALADLPMGMTAHIVFTAIDPTGPATTSAAMMDVIRNEIGLRGLLMTDDISMQALKGSVSERSAAAIAAGCDVVLHCNGDLSEMEAVAAASGMMTSAAQTRADAALSARGEPGSFDIAAMEAEFDTLMKGRVHG